MQTPNSTSTVVSLAEKYQNPTADQHAAASKIQAAVREKLTGITRFNQPSIFTRTIPLSIFTGRTTIFSSNDLRQTTNHSTPSVNQLSEVRPSNSLNPRLLLLCRALAAGVLSVRPNPPELRVTCVAAIVDLATKVPSLRALANRMNPDNTATLQSVLTAIGKQIGRGNWFGVSKLNLLNASPDQRFLRNTLSYSLIFAGLFPNDSTRITGYSERTTQPVDIARNEAAFYLDIDQASFQALAHGFANNPIRTEETVSVAELALQVSESLNQHADAAPNQRGFLMLSLFGNPPGVVTPHEIEQLVAGTGGDLDAVVRNLRAL